MPKNIHNIKTFLTGIVSSPDAKDIPEDAAESSLNIDPVSSDGRLQSIGGDFNVVEEESILQTPDVFNFVNVDGSRLLVGANAVSNSIQTLDNVNPQIDHPIFGTTEPRPLIQTPVGTITEPTIVVNNNESYIGLGSQGASRPQFVGKVMTPNVTKTSTSEVVIEDAENKPLDVSYYKINKIATTIPATDSAFGNTKSTELKYVWGVGNGNNFLYRITVDEDDTEGTIVLSNIIKDSDGINIPTNLVSIATCISQNNMLWATGEDQKIYRLHVNATTNNVTIESIIELSFNKQAGAANGLQFNESNKPPPDDAVLSDIIEAKNADGTKSELVISYFKEDGFSSRESYMYSRTLTPWDSSDIVEDNPDEFLEDPANLISDTEIITRTYFENFLFRDISTIFDDVSTFTTRLDIGPNDNSIISNSFDLAFRTSFLTSEGSSNQTISTQEVVRTFPDETGIFSQGFNNFEESIGQIIGFKKLIINTNNTYPFKQSSGEHIYKNDADFFNSTGINSDGESAGYKVIHARDFEHTTGNHLDAISKFSLGRNLGFEAGFRLKVNKYGLVATNESESLNEGNDIYVHLFSTCDKKFIKDGGSVFVKQISNFSSGKTFFGASGLSTQDMPNGFFISTKASYGVDEYRKPFYISGFNDAELNSDNEGDTNYIPGDESTIMAASCLPHESEFGQTDLSRLGEAALILPTSGYGGFGSIDDKSIFESFAIDRFGERNSLTTTTTFAPADNENIVFMSLSEKSGISERFTKTTLYAADFDSIRLDGGYTSNGLKTGIDFLKLAKSDFDSSATTFITPKTTTDLGGSCIFPIFNTASLNHGGAGANDYRIWMFSLHSAGSNNYRNGIQDTQPSGDSNLFNDFNGNFTEKQTAYSSLTFDKDTDGDEKTFLNGAVLFYNLAIVFDNGSVSKLGQHDWEKTLDEDVDGLRITIRINAKDVSPRAVALQLYRRGFDSNGASETQYHLALNDISLLSGWKRILISNDTGEETTFLEKTVYDRGEQIGLYQDISGLSLTNVTATTLPNYGISTIVNDKHIIGHCFTEELGNMPNRLFASLTGRYNSFRIDDQLSTLLLPTKPTALIGFNGRLFAFDETTMYIINTDAMIIEDQLEGVGCSSQKSVIATEFGMFIANNSNIYHYTGESTIPIASSILKSKNNIGWLEKYKGYKPILSFDNNKSSLIVIFLPGIEDYDGDDDIDSLDVVFAISDTTLAWVYNLRLKRWDLWETPKTPKDMAIDKDGDVMISGLQSISKYAVDSNNKRQWEWISKQITLGEDNKSKKYYKVETHSNTDEEFIQYSIDKGDFIQGSNISKKAKSLQIKIDSEDPNLEVDSISIPYRNLPNSKQNL